jgi:hypothetical protein
MPICNGSMTLDRDGKISGIVNGRLIVEADANVRVTGIVNGGTENRGGRVRVTGLVHG